MRWAFLALGLTALTACSGEGLKLPTLQAPDFSGLGASFASLTTRNRDAVTQIAMAGGAVLARAPRGYCFDGAARRNGSFVVMASCQAITRGSSGHRVPPGVLTVFVGDPDPEFSPPAPSSIATALDAEILFQRRISGVDFLHLGSGGDSVLRSGDPRHWRAIDVVGDRPVILSLYAPEDGALASRGGTALLRELRAGLQLSSGS